jgi:glutamine cyclotransferase
MTRQAVKPSGLRIRSVCLVIPFLSVACSGEVPRGTIEVLEALAHDSTAYTQGLVMIGGDLFESTGRYGESTIRLLDPSSGATLAVESVPDGFFAEGLAAHEGRLIQVTWREYKAFVYDPATLTLEDTLSVDTFGWGLCSDGQDLFMTSGGSILYRREPDSLARVEEIQITRLGVPFWAVNELECVGSSVFGNVFQSTVIVQIDKATGRVTTEYDAAALVPTSLRGSRDAVLNGIAYDSESDTFLLTGKLWPVMYRVRLIEPQ